MSGRIDVYAGEEHFADHLLPVYQALDNPGDFIIEPTVTDNGGNRWNGTFYPEDPSRPVLVASFGDQKRMRKAGRTRIARIEHGAGQSYGTGHGSYAGGRDCGDVSLFLMPNEYSARLWREAYPDARVEIVGCPKLDTLPRKDPSEPLTVAISFHWDCHLLPETVSAFGHFRSVLPKLRDSVNLIGHGHPRGWVGPPSLEKRYRRDDITAERSFDEVCRKADLYITDNSSSLYEFAATGRPVVVLNAPSYRRDFHPGLRFWDAANVGVQVDRPQNLLDAVSLALQDGPQQRVAREDALGMVYAYRSGAAQRAARVLEDWA